MISLEHAYRGKHSWLSYVFMTMVSLLMTVIPLLMTVIPLLMILSADTDLYFTV